MNIESNIYANKTKGLIKESKEYYLISNDAFDDYKPSEYSHPLIRSLYGEYDEVRIAVINFDKFEEYYNSLSEDYIVSKLIYAQEITGTNIDIDEFNIDHIRTNNLFKYILDMFGVTGNKNVCALIGGISEKFKMSPIELFDHLHEYQFSNTNKEED